MHQPASQPTKERTKRPSSDVEKGRMENQDSDLGKEKKVTKKPTISFVTCTAAAAAVDEEGGRELGRFRTTSCFRSLLPHLKRFPSPRGRIHSLHALTRNGPISSGRLKKPLRGQ